MSAASFESLPNELFERVVQQLGLDDIRNIRLVSRSTASKAVQETYRSFFRETHVELRRENLQSFAKATSPGGIGDLVKHLTLIVIVYNPTHLQACIENGRPPRRPGSSRSARSYTAEELEAVKQDLAMLERRRKADEVLRQEGTDLMLLRKAFSNLVLSKSNPLKRLSLRMRVHRGETVKTRSSSLWRSKRVFSAATSIYWLTMESLRSSQLKVEALDILYKWHEQLESSLPCDDLRSLDLDPAGGLGSCLSTLKTLSISITDPMVDETKYDTQDPEDNASYIASGVEGYTSDATPSRDIIANDKYYSALSEMVQSCPNLQEINIVGYPLDCYDVELARLQKTMRTRHMHHLALSPRFPQLRKLCLAGLGMLDTDLLKLLRSHIRSLRELDLTKIRLPEGSFSSVVSYITGRETGFVVIHFDDIREGDELLMFRRTSQGEGADGNSCDIVRRWGIERKGDINYFGTELRLIGWPTAWEWTLEEKFSEEEEEDD